MHALYRKPPSLPSLLLLGVLVSGCDRPATPPQVAEPLPNPYLQALQEAEALKYDVEQRQLEQQRIDTLLDR